ncbi:LPS export ABC transporter periplasmic protein LptC [Nostoc sp. CCY0012]|uniref:LPS export ABC transporter periplasmic protein LptC n=1 Tax=Nostoc sp. CCY0012 TaxID=1056123 RepID=UPI0039C612A8
MNYQKGRKKLRENETKPSGIKQSSPQFCSLLSFNSLKLKANWYYLPLIFLLIIGLVACGRSTPTASQSNDADSSSQESNLTFFDVTLEQADEVGRPLWRVQSKKATYTQEKQIGKAENPYGELYQDGKAIYQIKASQAEIKQDGKQLFLQGNIVATDPSNGIILRGNELEWRPEEDLLIVRNQLKGTHKQLQAVAQEARVKTREQRMEFSGGVVATSADPQMQLRTEHLIWQIQEEKLIGDRPIQIDRYNNNQITDRGRGDAAEVNLKTKIATIKKNGQLDIADPPTQITSDVMTWDMNAEKVTANSPVRIVQSAENVTVTANQGEMKIPQKIVNVTGNVNAIGQRQQTLRSNRLTWYLDKKLLEAQGNIVYRQIDPPLNFTGDTAVGNLETENIVVRGGTGNRVVTEIIPQNALIRN